MNNSHDWPLLIGGVRHKIFANVTRDAPDTQVHHVSIALDNRWAIAGAPVPPEGASYFIDVEGRRVEIAVEKGVRHLASLVFPA
jgi:hypothetical protein